MLAGGYSWRLFFYVEAAFAAALLILAFLFVEETTYKRPEPTTESLPPSVNESEEKIQGATQMENVAPVVLPERKSFFKTLKPWSSVDPDAQFFVTMFRSFTYFLVPAVFWVISSFGAFHHEIRQIEAPC